METPGASTSPSGGAGRSLNSTSSFWGSTLTRNENTRSPSENHLSSLNIIVACVVFAIGVILAPALYLMWEKRRQTRVSSQQEASRANGEAQQDQGDTSSTKAAEVETTRMVEQYIFTNSLILHAGHFFTTLEANECYHTPSTSSTSTSTSSDVGGRGVDLENGGESNQSDASSDQISHQDETKKEGHGDSSRTGSLEALSDHSDKVSSQETQVVARNAYLSQVAVEEMQQKLKRTDDLLPNRTKRPVASECAICLSSYEEGHSVVGSSNPSCAHIFHSNCIEEWLVSRRGRSPDDLLCCPCCRQRFLLLDEETDLEQGFAVLTPGASI